MEVNEDQKERNKEMRGEEDRKERREEEEIEDEEYLEESRNTLKRNISFLQELLLHKSNLTISNNAGIEDTNFTSNISS